MPWIFLCKYIFITRVLLSKLKNGLVSLAGLCLYLDNNSTIEYHECNTLYDGCPDRNYQSFELYKCKQTIFLLYIFVLIFILWAVCWFCAWMRAFLCKSNVICTYQMSFQRPVNSPWQVLSNIPIAMYLSVWRHYD